MDLPTTVVHLKMKGGKSLVDYDVYIGRCMYQGGWRLPTSKWANPYRLKDFGSDRAAVLEKYRAHVVSRPDLMEALPELRGKRLGCWCVGPKCLTCFKRRGQCAHLQCHGEVLVELLAALGAPGPAPPLALDTPGPAPPLALDTPGPAPPLTPGPAPPLTPDPTAFVLPDDDPLWEELGI